MLIAGEALRTMRLVNKATSNYHVDAQHACAARAQCKVSLETGFMRTCQRPPKPHPRPPPRLHQRDRHTIFEPRTYTIYSRAPSLPQLLEQFLRFLPVRLLQPEPRANGVLRQAVQALGERFTEQELTDIRAEVRRLGHIYET